MSGRAIRLDGVGKTFTDGTRGLQPVDLSIGRGEIVVVLGPSGCGKTTLLRLLAGLEQPDGGGRILFDEVDVTALPVEKRGVGMVFQSYALFPHMSVAGNVGYGLRVQRWKRAARRERVAEMLATARLSDLAARRVDKLSGGQRQRVALARALAPKSGIILLDEPLTALDAGLREGLRADIEAMVRGQGATALHVTHDQAEALALADRIVVMREGRIVQVGTPREVYFAPASDEVARFFGPVNRLQGRVTAGSFETQWGTIPLAHPDGPATITFRPESLTPAPDGPLAFEVVASVFEGTRQRLTLAAGDEILIAHAPGALAVGRGQVRFAVDTTSLLDLKGL
ncbi:ABC transporter ATP-binding protein [Acuticoccus kandeliae]|uniref:ABC transporter ATP-binding protein n=1 Tax=Acuticoccus kandeliae TaxID=2073160 RepID=UPI000D3E960E|nr:ABC transporter ATP-binding protein [Acuticoccus kandeliae]